MAKDQIPNLQDRFAPVQPVFSSVQDACRYLDALELQELSPKSRQDD